MSTELMSIIPVLPSADIARDITWHREKTGFVEYFSDNMYAVLYRDNLTIHLQWHADTKEDPLRRFGNKNHGEKYTTTIC